MRRSAIIAGLVVAGSLALSGCSKPSTALVNASANTIPSGKVCFGIQNGTIFKATFLPGGMIHLEYSPVGVVDQVYFNLGTGSAAGLKSVHGTWYRFNRVAEDRVEMIRRHRSLVTLGCGSNLNEAQAAQARLVGMDYH